MYKVILLTLLCLIATMLYTQTPFFTETFEDDADGWTFTTGNTVNRWVRGNDATANGAGSTHSMYITNSANSPYANAYTVTDGSTRAFAYTTINFPAGVSGLRINFDIKVVGDHNFHYARVYMMPTGTTIAGANTGLGATATDPYETHIIGLPQYNGTNSGPFAQQPGNVWHNVTIDNLDSWIGQNGLLVFAWYNDGYGGGQPPAAIDNITISGFSASDPPQPALIVYPANGATSVPQSPPLTWAVNPQGSTPTGYKIFIDTDENLANAGAGQDLGDVLTYTPSPKLLRNTTYYWKVVPYTTSDASGCPIWSFTTATEELFIIGTGTAPVGAPVNPFYPYSVSQQIYLNTELATAGLTGGRISQIAFQSNKTNEPGMNYFSNSNSWMVYMGETAINSFADANSWIPLDNMQMVFDGTVDFTDVVTGDWITVDLPTPFTYTGENNLLIFVNEYSYSMCNFTANDTNFRGTSTGSDFRTLRSGNDNGQYIPVPEATIPWTNNEGYGTLPSLLTANRPNIMLKYSAPTTGLDLAVTAFTGPALLPDDDLVVTVMNMGSTAVENGDYTVNIYIGDTTGTPIGTISTVEPLAGVTDFVYASHDFEIPASTYNAWFNSVVAGGNITLVAKVITTGTDLEGANNSRSFTTAIRPLYDIGIASVTGPTVYPGFAPLVISVENNGRTVVPPASYNVAVTITGSGFNKTFTGATALEIEIGESVDYAITATEMQPLLDAANIANGFVFNIAVTSTGATDTVPDNNTATFASSIYSGDIEADGIIEVGIAGTDTQGFVPFSFNFQDNIAQTLYTASDFGDLSSGVITHINYKVTIADLSDDYGHELIDPYPVSIYMANVAKTSFVSDSDWVPGDAFDLVFANDLPIHTVGTYDFWLELNPPFVYTGGDLAVMTYKDHSIFAPNTNRFWQTPDDTDNFMTIYDRTDVVGTNFDPANPSGFGDRLDFRPQTRFAVSLPTNGLDLALNGFTVPQKLPSTGDMLVTVTNMGNQAVTAYEVKIYQVSGGNSTILYEIPSASIMPLAAVAGNDYDSHTYHIPVAIYNSWWASTVPSGEVTLKAVVTIAGDTVQRNNERTTTATLKTPRDIAVSSVSGPTMFPTVHNVNITLENNGRVAFDASSYTLAVGIGGTTLHTISGADAVAIGLGSSQTLEIAPAIINPLLSSYSGNITFTVTVSATPADDISANNVVTLPASIFNGGFPTDGIAEGGVSGDETSNFIPFGFWNRDSISQSIYHSSTFGGVEEGIITHINYTMNIRDNITSYNPVSVYMANFDKTSFTSTSDWVAGSEFTCVVSAFDLPVQPPQSENRSFWIPLDAPFAYTGGDLIVMTNSDQDSYYTTSNFYMSPYIAGSAQTLMNGTDDQGNFNPLNPSGAGYVYDFTPQTRFALILEDIGIISGKVTKQGTAEELSGVVITQGAFSTTSDAQGDYEIYVHKTSTTPLSFAKVGYATHTLDVSAVTGWVTHTNGFDTYEHNVTLATVAAVAVSGTVTLADNGDPALEVTVTIGGLSDDTDDTLGEYSISGLFPYATYPVTVTFDPEYYPDYVSYSGEVYINPALVVAGVFPYNITIAEDMKPPILVSASKNANNNPVVNWYNPYLNQIDFTLCTTGEFDEGLYDDEWVYIAVHRYSHNMLSDLGLLGADLMSVGFAPVFTPYDDTEIFTILIWTGANLTEPDQDNPTYSQTVTQPLMGGEYNDVILDTPFPIPTTGELAIGVKVPAYNGVRLRGTSGGNLSGYGDLIYDYDEEAWYSLFVASQGYWYEHWRIRGLAIAPTPDGAVRAFEGNYNVYRLADGASFDEATLLTANPITGGAALQKTFTDNTSITIPGAYKYAVTTVYEGDNYTTYDESLPAYSNILGLYYTVSGTIVGEAGENIVGLTVTLENQAVGGHSPDAFVTVAGGAFAFHVLPGTYHLIVSRYSQSYTYTDTNDEPDIVVTASDVTGLVVNVPQNVSDDDISAVPLVTGLGGNYPNPFNPTTTISFTLATESRVSIDIYNIKGQRVKQVANDSFTAGRHNVVWNGDDFSGKPVGSGVYFYRMTAPGYSGVKKMLLLK